jgi:hypothetical protein
VKYSREATKITEKIEGLITQKKRCIREIHEIYAQIVFLERTRPNVPNDYLV